MTTVSHIVARLKANWGWYLALGIALVVLGTLALTFAYTSTLFSVLYLGATLIIVGILESVQALKMQRFGRFILHAGLGVVYVCAGGYIFYNPAINAISLTLLIAWFFIFSGIFKMIFAFWRSVPHHVTLAINGLITLVLGVLILQQWPASGLWVLGMFLGIDMIFTGWSWIMLAFAAKNI